MKSKPSLMARATKFYNDNWIVWTKFEEFALEAWEAGRTRYGAKSVWERLRWWTNVEVKTVEPFKLSNDFHAYYARMFILVHPDKAALFQLKRSVLDTDEMFLDTMADSRMWQQEFGGKRSKADRSSRAVAQPVHETRVGG